MDPIDVVTVEPGNVYQYTKVLWCAVVAWMALSFSACGVSTPSGYVMGTTSYLQEYNAGQAEHTEEDKRKMANLIERRF